MRIKANRRSFTVKPVVDGGTAYSSGNAVDTTLNIPAAVLSADQAGQLKQLIVADAAQQNAALDIVLFQIAIDPAVDNATFSPTKAELKESIGVVKVAAVDYVNIDTQSIATVDLNLDFQLEKSTTLFLQIVAVGTPTYPNSDDLQLKFVIEQD